MKSDESTKGLPMLLIQSLAFVILALLLIFDKGLGLMVNPPSDYFYLGASGSRSNRSKFNK
jgi:hypothetical protein